MSKLKDAVERLDIPGTMIRLLFQAIKEQKVYLTIAGKRLVLQVTAIEDAEE